MDEFEPILLKNLLKNSEFFSKSMGIIEHNYFKSIGNSEFFKLIKKHYSEYKTIPNNTEIIASVKNVQNSEIRNAIVESSKSMQPVEEITNTKFLLDETVKWVKDALYLEALQIGSDGLMKKDDAMKLKAQGILDKMAKISIDSDLGLDFDDIETMIKYYQERNVGIKSTHKELNKRLGSGFLPGTLNVILAAQGIGKSLLKVDLMSGMLKDNKNILFISLEMSDKEIMKRVHANALDLPINSLVDLAKTEGELREINDRILLTKEDVVTAYNMAKTSGKCGKLYVKDYPAGSFSALQLEALVESYRIEKGIIFDIVFVDYLGIMKSDLVSPAAGLYSYIKSIGEEVRASAKKLYVPIVSSSQLNRGVHGKEASDVDNSSISDSMGTAMTADFMLFLLQNEEMKERKEFVLKCTKNRYTGRTDTWMMNIDYEHMRFNDMITENSLEHTKMLEDLANNNKPSDALDFGIVTADKMKVADEFATQEVKDIISKDMEILSKEKSNPLLDNTEELFRQLGI